MTTGLGRRSTTASGQGGLIRTGANGHVREVFIARRIDFRLRRVVLYDNSNWVVASYDLDRCAIGNGPRPRLCIRTTIIIPAGTCSQSRLGRTVHVEYFGVH